MSVNRWENGQTRPTALAWRRILELESGSDEPEGRPRRMLAERPAAYRHVQDAHASNRPESGATSEPSAPLYWRIVRSNPASWVDFLSNAARDLPARPVEVRDPLDWASISVFDSADEAAERARRYGLGRYLAALRIPDDGLVQGVRIVVRQTYGPGHYSLLAGPVTFMRAIERLVPVEEGRRV